jgi:hypothetical protein
VEPPRENAGYFRKPFDPQGLVQRLEELYRAQRLPGERQ